MTRFACTRMCCMYCTYIRVHSSWIIRRALGTIYAMKSITRMRSESFAIQRNMYLKICIWKYSAIVFDWIERVTVVQHLQRCRSLFKIIINFLQCQYSRNSKNITLCRFSHSEEKLADLVVENTYVDVRSPHVSAFVQKSTRFQTKQKKKKKKKKTSVTKSNDRKLTHTLKTRQRKNCWFKRTILQHH